MTPTDLQEYLRIQTELKLHVFVSYDTAYARYLVLTEKGAKHYMNVPLTSEFSWLLSRYKVDLVKEIKRTDTIIQTQWTLNNATRELISLTKSDDRALKTAKEVLNHHAKD